MTDGQRKYKVTSRKRVKYKKYFKKLPKTRQSEKAEEAQRQCKVEQEFQQITNRQGNKKERITEIIRWKAIRRINNKKTSDKLGWKTK